MKHQILKEELVFDPFLRHLIYNPKHKRIYQLAISKNHRGKGLGNRLIDHIYQLEKEIVTFINIDSRTEGMESFLKNRGLENYVNQYEMEMDLV